MEDIREGCSDRGPFRIRKTYYNLLETRKGKFVWGVCMLYCPKVRNPNWTQWSTRGYVRTNSISPLVQFILDVKSYENSKCLMSELQLFLTV